MYSKRSNGGKTCSVCGTWHTDSHYTYRNRENRSYCQKCDALVGKADASGVEGAAQKLREEIRKKNGLI